MPVRRRAGWKRLLVDLHSAEPERRRHAVGRMRYKGGRRAVGALLRALHDPEAKVRAMAALCLGGLCSTRAAQALAGHLREDVSANVRTTCSVALGWIDAPLATDALIGALADPEVKAVSMATIGLARKGDARAVAPLKQLLARDSWKLRLDACETLLRLGVADDQIVAALEDLGGQPEAADHDRMMDEFAQLNREKGLRAGPSPGPRKMGELLAEARRLRG